MAIKKLFRLFLATVPAVLAMGCNPSIEKTDMAEQAKQFNPYNDTVVKAINVGGDEVLASDGIVYAADPVVTGVGTISEIKGTQNPELFTSFRMAPKGEAYRQQIELNDGRYSVALMFAEPDEIEVGERVFSIYLQNREVIPTLDVRGERDGKIRSALVRTVTDIEVVNGVLDIELKPIKGQAFLSAIVIRETVSDPRPWSLIWHDEFDYEGSPDPTKWKHNVWPARKVNDEDQAYTNRNKNTRVENGKLVIEAHREDYDNAQYTSGRLHNQGLGDFLYGKVEVSARVPKGQGTWAAIWMLPSDPFRYATTCEEGADWQGSATCDAWPNSGEIDILEHVGYDMQLIHGTVHTKAYYWKNWEQRKASIEGQTVDTAFHKYAMEWNEEHIIISLNDVPYFIYKNEKTDWRTWPFDHPYHLILNLAVGGQWGRAGGPIDESVFPARMEIDYVRIYQIPQ